MNSLFFLTIFLVSIFQTSVTCNDIAGSDIHYPFTTLYGFDLSHKDNITTIHFPSYGDLTVKSISYDSRKIDLLDPKNCVPRVFLNLNLTLTPFQYYYVLQNYTYLNCSTKLLHTNFIEVPCLSDSNSHVYTVDPEVSLPSSCRIVKTVAIPFKYSPYISDNSLGLRLTWKLRASEETKQGNKTRGSDTKRNTVFGLSICFIVMATVVGIIKVHLSLRNLHKKEEQLLADF
ncbi:RING-H2 finger protein ATL20-like [Vicia villosa]|uniref:RING-H2 finger protein ATL20-like n=1 Tax=Vicia villosa TaxID=3911 RepID=UPI00273ABB48|nr:RING-H2 finger protein ATL20-like [Vicia villosa]